MFLILMVVSILGLLATGYWIYMIPSHRRFSISLGILCVIIFFLAWQTPEGHMKWQKLTAGTKHGNWLVIDNSGGETLRHWILTNGYVESAKDSDGWEFFDSRGNGPIYVSGDAFVMRINEPLEEFKKNYRKRYNVPQNLIALQ